MRACELSVSEFCREVRPEGPSPPSPGRELGDDRRRQRLHHLWCRDVCTRPLRFCVSIQIRRCWPVATGRWTTGRMSGEFGSTAVGLMGDHPPRICAAGGGVDLPVGCQGILRRRGPRDGWSRGASRWVSVSVGAAPHFFFKKNKKTKLFMIQRVEVNNKTRSNINQKRR